MEALIVVFVSVISVVIGLTKEGCDDDWLYFNQLCYRYNSHAYDAIVAKDICSGEGSTLASVWTEEEKQFITNALVSQVESVFWVGLVPKPNTEGEWVWLDGSKAEINSDGQSNIGMCGAMKGDGEIIFKDCYQVLPGFICKKSLEMTYIISELSNSMKAFDAEPPKLLFERLWPPKLLDFPKYAKHIAHTKVSYVAHETDCAYYCSHVTGCQAFTIHCSLPMKCYQYACDLFQSK